MPCQLIGTEHFRGIHNPVKFLSRNETAFHGCLPECQTSRVRCFRYVGRFVIPDMRRKSGYQNE